jgi:hypothetical protein
MNENQVLLMKQMPKAEWRLRKPLHCWEKRLQWKTQLQRKMPNHPPKQVSHSNMKRINQELVKEKKKPSKRNKPRSEGLQLVAPGAKGFQQYFLPRLGNIARNCAKHQNDDIPDVEDDYKGP